MPSPPAFLIAATQSLPISSWTSVTTTTAPSLARSCALARPMPLAPPVTRATFPLTRSMGVLLVQLGDEGFDGRIEGFRLIDIGGVTGIGNDRLFRARNLRRHIVERREKRRVVGADDDDRRHLDVGKGLDHARILLREHAATGTREPLGIAMLRGGTFGARIAEKAQAFLFIALGRAQRRLVPAFARLVILVAGTGVDDQERAHALGVARMKRQRHVAAEREAADDGRLGADLVQKRQHVGDRRLLTIE